MYAGQLPLKLSPIPIAIPEFRESLQWPATLDGDPAIVWLREIIVELARGLGQKRARP